MTVQRCGWCSDDPLYIDHTNGLHKGIANGGANKFKTSLF